MLAKCTDGSVTEWDKKLPFLLFTYLPYNLQPRRVRSSYCMAEIRGCSVEAFWIKHAQIIWWTWRITGRTTSESENCLRTRFGQHQRSSAEMEHILWPSQLQPCVQGCMVTESWFTCLRRSQQLARPFHDPFRVVNSNAGWSAADRKSRRPSSLCCYWQIAQVLQWNDRWELDWPSA